MQTLPLAVPNSAEPCLFANDLSNTPILHTQRLVLKPARLEDAPAIQTLIAHWEIVRFMVNAPWPYPRDGVFNHMSSVTLPGMHQGILWSWTLRLRSEPEQIIGAITLKDGQLNRSFWLGLGWQGLGLMSEASNVATDFWFENLGRGVLRVSKAVSNSASKAISEKSGMRVVWSGIRSYTAGDLPAQVWEISRDEWRTYRHSMLLSKAA